VPLNMLNWRMIPLLRGVPNVSEPIHRFDTTQHGVMVHKEGATFAVAPIFIFI